jgi:hypothetical protein
LLREHKERSGGKLGRSIEVNSPNGMKDPILGMEAGGIR